MKKTVCIVIPVFNESATIRHLVQKIFAAIDQVSIIIVDDSSEAQHKKIMQALQGVKVIKGKHSVRVIYRKRKLGRGGAVLRGFREGVTNSGCDYFVEMDGDLSHEPSELPRFLAVANADVVIGSRYLAGSKIIDWPYRRLIMSKVINLFLQSWLQLNIHDYSNGYRLYNRKAVEFLLGQSFKESGFILLSEMAYKLHTAGFKIVEVPITFTDRKQGKSSVSFADLLYSLIGAVRIRF